ncbi:MAG: AMP-binding protein, partial [Actinomycetota bacterium]|nr:AMP-binding protein [Actinomycetota bacterium]
MSGFYKYAQQDPDFVAVVDPDGTEHRAGDLLARANRYVHLLRSLGLQKGDAVAAVLPNGVKPIEVYLAALQAGWYYVPINYRLSAPEIAYIVQDSGAKAIVSDERYAGVASAAADEAGLPKEARLAHGEVPGFTSVEAGLAEQPDTLPDERSAGAAMHYTSGTTGKPKGVKRQLHDADPDIMAELFTGFFNLFGIPHREDQVHLCTSPNYHTAVTTFAGNSLHSGHRVVFMDKWDPEQTLAKIQEQRVTHTHMVPTQFHRML